VQVVTDYLPAMDKLNIALWVMAAVLILIGVYLWFAPPVVWTSPL
jgi:cytochrome c-type biogenesis protein CcmH/NrfF